MSEGQNLLQAGGKRGNKAADQSMKFFPINDGSIAVMQIATSMLTYFVLPPCNETDFQFRWHKMTLLRIPPHPPIGFTDGYDWKSAHYLTAPLCYCIFRKIWQAPCLLWQHKTASWQGQGAPVCGDSHGSNEARWKESHTYMQASTHKHAHIAQLSRTMTGH